MRAMRPSWMGVFSEEDRRDMEVGLEQVRQSLVERYASRVAAGLPVFAEDAADTELDTVLGEAGAAERAAALAV